MKTPHLDKLRANLEGDPTAKDILTDQHRAMRPVILSAQAQWESMFPPESPTSARRGGNKLAPSPELIDAVCAILDAKTGNPVDIDFIRAMKSADVEFFRLMAEAAQYVRNMPHAHSLFARHVITARRVAASMMVKGETLPSWFTVRQQVAAVMEQAAYDETSKEWSRVRRASCLVDLPR